MIWVLYAQLGEMLPPQAWQRYFVEMPRSVQSAISRYLRWQDRQAGLFGKLLLAEGLARCGYPREHLRNLVWDCAGRPFLGCRMDFNISHSGGYVVCALCPGGRVGIDIEQIRAIDISDFKAQMTCEQWAEIMASDHRLATFFRLWTQKESVVKADGRGIAAPMDDITIAGEKAFIADDIWGMTEVGIADGYCCHLATREIKPAIRIEKIVLC